MISAGSRFRLLFLSTLSCGASIAAAAEIQGTARFRERMALPSNAVFEASLEDVSRADGPATIVGQTRIVRPPAPPISFRIPFDQADLDRRHRYVVRARITVEGRAMFVTEQAPRVLERGVDHNVALTLVRAPREPSAPAATIPRLPADFTGVLPCRDCAGIRQTLRLLPGNGYHLASTQLRSGQDVTTWEHGSWDVSSDRRVLRLDRERGNDLRFEVRDASTLRPLETDGRPRGNGAGSDLRRTREPLTLQPRGRMRGMYRYQADAGWFTDCATGQRLRVAQEGANDPLERAYTRNRREPGDELQVTLDGRIESRPRMEGMGEETALIVERFVDTRPGERCGSGRVMSSLEGTRWVPIRIGSRTITVRSEAREPYLNLESKSRKVTGFGGCNRFFAGFRHTTDSLRFDRIGSTMMTCPPGTFDERELFDVLESTRTWRVLGRELELFDHTGAPIARFEARDL